MTRGTAYLITDKEIYSHCEFNGDMFPSTEGRGKEFLDLLHGSTPKTFEENMKRFNDKYYGYKGFRVYKDDLSKWECIRAVDNMLVVDFNDDYSKWFFSDYVYFKNASQKSIEFLCTDGLRFILESEASCVFHFGKMTKNFIVVY